MATESTEISLREKKNYNSSVEMATEGIVLLKNNGALPLKENEKTVALFGNGARLTLKGGSGSGDVNVREFTTIEKALKDSHFTVTTEAILESYSQSVEKNHREYISKIKEVSKENPLIGLFTMMGNPFVSPDIDLLDENDFEKTNDVAIYVLARATGEGADRKLTKGDYYLTDNEIDNIKLLSNLYSKVILLLNVGSVVEIEPVMEYCDAVLLIGQGGIGAGEAAVNVLIGKNTPSGKLTATWAKSYNDYPFSNEYAPVSGEKTDAIYSEDVFVGYRYFSSFKVKPLFPFGFGLSYTNFDTDCKILSVVGSKVTVEGTVKNIGNDFSGKEVLQVYVSPPASHTHKPCETLVAFSKTKELKPNEAESLSICFDIYDFATYNETLASWVIEKGCYTVKCGNSLTSAKPIGVLKFKDDVILTACKNLLRGADIPNPTPAKTEDVLNLPVFTVDINSIKTETIEYTNHNDKISSDKRELVEKLSVREMALLCIGGARINLSDITLVGNYSAQIPGAAGETTAELQKYGIPSIVVVDGPAGVRINPKIYEKDGKYLNNPKDDPILKYVLPDDKLNVDLSGATVKYQYCTALPVATVLAQTWNKDILYNAGVLVGEELDELGIPVWLAPALNIQRNPLCGRNFEYFSEDPLLSGICASEITKGVQSIKNKSVTIKHLAANNQETNRNFNNSVVSERALREIYLKGFEICVKRASPNAAMTSVNLINGVHTANDVDLLHSVLRNEWGFKGLVMTDWGTTGVPGSNKEQKYDCSYAPICMKAGNDLIMPGSQRDVDYIVNAVESEELDKEDLINCCINVLNLIEKSTKG